MLSNPNRKTDPDTDRIITRGLWAVVIIGAIALSAIPLFLLLDIRSELRKINERAKTERK